MTPDRNTQSGIIQRQPAWIGLGECKVVSRRFGRGTGLCQGQSLGFLAVEASACGYSFVAGCAADGVSLPSVGFSSLFSGESASSSLFLMMYCTMTEILRLAGSRGASGLRR